MLLKMFVSIVLNKAKSDLLKDLNKDEAYFLSLPPSKLKEEIIKRIQANKSLPGELRRVLSKIVNACGGETSLILFSTIKDVLD